MTSIDNRNPNQNQVSSAQLNSPLTMTVVFSDIKSYTQMSKSLHAAKLKEFLDSYLHKMGEIINCYGGTIDKIMGDGILALFCNHSSCTDHSKNAVEASWEMQKAANGLRQKWQQLSSRLDLQIRIGIATGEVILSETPLRSQNRNIAVGSVVNLASRLQEKATPGTILISQSTYRHISDYFVCRPISDLELKGFADSYSAYEILGRATDLKAQNKLEENKAGIKKEKRLSPRQLLEINVDYTVGSNRFVNRSVNVSERGMFVATSKMHPVNSPLTINANLPTDRGVLPISINGKIVRITAEQGIGIEFTKVQCSQLKTVHYLINSVYGLADLSRTRAAPDKAPRVDSTIPSIPEILRLTDDTGSISSNDLSCGTASQLNARLRHEFHRTKRYSHEFSCIALRLEKLPELGDNETKVYALKAIAQQITLSIRNTDEIFYLRGGVFVVLAPETMANRVKTLATRIVTEIHSFFQAQNPVFKQLEIQAGTFSFDGRNAKDHHQVLEFTLDATEYK